MKFSHPLARSARIWSTRMTDGTDHKVLTILTTLELDAEHKKYKSELVERLEAAARAHLAEHAGVADGFLLMNKPKS